ncbi:MAG TPA: hypothetical protein VM529_19380, partial [Gemmata sp.]|nr:hypothetical protein [Gemmata sp.]
MSRRTVARFTLVGLLGLSLAAPAAAQEPLRVRVVETRTGSFMFGAFSTDAPAEVAPMPRQVPARGPGEFEFPFEEVISGRVIVQPAVRPAAPLCDGGFCTPVNGGTPEAEATQYFEVFEGCDQVLGRYRGPRPVYVQN